MSINQKTSLTNTIDTTKDTLKKIGRITVLTSAILASVLGVRLGGGIAVENKVGSKFPGYEVTDVSYKPFGNFQDPEYFLLGKSGICYKREAKNTVGEEITGTAGTNILWTMVNKDQ